MTLSLQTQPSRVSRRGFRPQPMASHLITVEPCLHAEIVREDIGR